MFFTKSPTEILRHLKSKIKRTWKTAFFAAILIGLAAHFMVIINDWPNHDGLSSMYFDQNMITSGRWFLTIACGVTSYFTLPWLIGLFAIFFVALGAAALTELLELDNSIAIVLISGLLAAFPALASTFAYIFTADGYMFALLLAILAVLVTKKYPLGFVAGGILLAFSMGTYQSYLAFTMILCIYMVAIICLETTGLKNILKKSLPYLYMGVTGVALYYIILKILLLIQNKQLADYQGINTLEQADRPGVLQSILHMYQDFIAFTTRGNVFINNGFSLVAVIVIALLVLYALGRVMKKNKLYKRPLFYLGAVLILAIVPLAANIILLISPEVNYHLIMRYQWVLFLILALAFLERYLKEEVPKINLMKWIAILCFGTLVLNFVVTDNIAYSNLAKKYEKTYAYCLRLADRIEQTEGYYTGMPVAMIGVISETNFPQTDLSLSVTSNIIGASGETLLYTSDNYQAFLKNYLDITIDLVSDEEMLEIYNSQIYQEMESFPGADSVKVVDGILYVKTE